jgi:hypothetical protein
MNKNVNTGKHSRFVVFVKRKIARTRPKKYFFLSKGDVTEQESHDNIFLLTTLTCIRCYRIILKHLQF